MPGSPAASPGPPYARSREGVRLAVRLTPRASRAGVQGIEAGSDGASYVKARVNAPAEGGKANRALIKLLAGALRVPASSVTIVAGAKDRRKTVEIAGDPAALETRVRRWLEEGS